MVGKSGVFISYARKDAEAFATGLRERLLHDARELHVWQDRPDIEGGVGWWRQIEEALDRVEFLVIVMTPAVLDSEVTRKEWRAARQRGVCVYPVKGPGFDFANPLLPRWISKAHIYDLDMQWDSFLAHLRRGCQATRVPFMAPDLPKDYVVRAEVFDTLRTRLLKPESSDPVAITVALTGAGGFGKTTLAAALCHDEAVGLSLDDGILWATLGQQPSVQGELARMYAALTGERPGFVSVEDAAQALAERLEHKNCLIVIDDVWDLAHLKPFLRGGAGCVRLITTRQASVAVDADRVSVDQMTSAEATSLLLARVDEGQREITPFRRLARRLGEWPLLLTLASAALRMRIDNGDTVAGALKYVNKAIDKRGITAFDRERAADRHEAVALTVALSLDMLSEDDRLRCEELGIFPEDVAVPIDVVGELWGLDTFDTEEALARLGNGSLIEFNLGTASLRVHDVIRSYFIERLGCRQAEAHRQLLSAWPDARHLPHAYAWRWLGYHLDAVQRNDDLAALLGDVEWLQRKLEEVDIYAVISDFRFVSEDSKLTLLAHALRLSSHVLAKDKGQLVAQLLGRLPLAERDLHSDLARLAWQRRRGWLRPLWPSLIGPGGALLRTLDSTEVPTALAVSLDGDRVLAGSSEGLVAVWDLRSGTPMRTLHALDGPSTDFAGPLAGSGSTFALLPDGRVVLGGPRGLALWDPGSEMQPLALAAIPEGVAALAVSADGRRAIVGSLKGGLSVWDLRSGERVLRLSGHRLGVTAVAVNENASLAISGSYDKTVKLWDLYDGTLIDTLFPRHDGVVYAVAMALNGSLALSAGGDRLIRVWDLHSGTLRAVLSGHQHRVYALALSHDGRRALSGSHDRTVRVWNLESGALQSTFDGHADAVNAVAFTPDERLALSGGEDRTVRIWQLGADNMRASMQQHDGWIHAVATLPDGSRAVTAGQDRMLREWDVDSGKVLRVLKGHHDAVSAAAFDARRGWLVSASYDRSVMLWPPNEIKPAMTLEGHGDAIATLSLSPDGTQALTGGLDGQVILWDLGRGRITRRWDAHRRAVSFVAAEPDWGTAVSGSADGTLRIWNLKTFACLCTLPAHHDGVMTGALSPTGDVLLSGGLDGTIRLWAFPSGEMLGTWPGHAGRVRALGIVPGGRLAFSGGYDRYVRLWTLPVGEPLAAFAADSAITSVASSDDGALLTAGDAQGCVHFLRYEDSPAEAGYRERQTQKF